MITYTLVTGLVEGLGWLLGQIGGVGVQGCEHRRDRSEWQSGQGCQLSAIASTPSEG